ncbi:hypothetical protein ACKVMT_11065 [Halobacteriales archaeon Cl-PHB]
MSRTADPSTTGQSADAQPADHRPADGQPPATAAAVRQVYQALRTLVPDRGRVTAADLATVTDLERERVEPAMTRLASEDPFDVERIETDDLAVWAVAR